MASIDSLSILITASTSSATTKINALTKSLGELRDAINALDVSKFERLATVTSDLSQGFANLKGMGVKEVKAIAKGISTVSEQKGSLDPVAKSAENVVEKTQEIAANTEQVSEGLSRIDSTSIDGLSESMNKVSNTLGKASSKMSLFKELISTTSIDMPTGGLDKLDKKITHLTEKIEDLRDKMDFKSRTQADYIDSDEMEKDQEKIEGLINELERLKLKYQELQTHGAEPLNLGKSASNLSKAFSAVNKKIDSFVSKVRRMKSSTKESSKATKDFSLASMRLAKELTRVTKMLKLMVTRMILRKVIQNAVDGFKNLIQYSSGVNASISMLWNSFRQLGNAVASAASPLLNALAPVLNYLIQLCIKLVNAINQVISALFGKSTWTKATKLSDDYGASLDKTNKSAKDLKRTILGFDEINQLQDNKDSGSGGGTSPADMFEEAPIESKWKNLAQKLKNILNKLLNPLKKAWENIGDQVVNAWKKAFNSVKKLLEDIGRDFLEVWNQPETLRMLENILRIFRDIGSIIHLLADNLDKAWNKNKTGLHILEAIRDIFAIIIQHVKNMTSATVLWAKNLDFSPILEAFQHWLESLKPVVDAIAGSFEDFYRKVLLPLSKWSLEKGLPELIDVFTRFNEEVQWDVIRERLNRVWEALEPFAERVGEGLVKFIDGVSSKIANFLNSKGWDDFIDTLVKWTNEIDADAVARGLSNIFQALAAYKTVSVLTTIVEKVTQLSDVAKAGIKVGIEFAIVITSAQWLVDKALALWQWVSRIAMENAGYSKVQIDVEMAWWTKFREEYGSTGGIGRLLWDFFTGDSDRKTAQMKAEAVVETLGVHEASIELEDLRQKTEDLGNSAGLQMFAEKADGSVEKLKNVNTVNFDPLKNNVDSVGKAVNDLAITVEKDTSAITKSASNIKFTPASTGAANLKNEVTTSFNGVKTTVENSSKAINRAVDNIKFTPLSDAASKLQTTVSDSFEDIDESAENTNKVMSDNIEQMTLTVTSGADDIISATDEIKDSFTKDKWTFNGVADGLGETFRRAKEAIKKQWNEIADTLNGEHQVANGTINIRLPKFYATGGFPDPEDGWFRASHGEMLGKFDNGQSVVANNTQIIEGIRQGVYDAVSMAMSTSQNNGSVPVQTSIYIGEEQVARAVTRGQRKLDRRYSPTMA